MNKKIGPIIVSICIIGYYVLVVFGLSILNIPNIFKIIAIIVSVIVTIVIIVLVERIKEINGGEEDDLGKY